MPSGRQPGDAAGRRAASARQKSSFMVPRGAGPGACPESPRLGVCAPCRGASHIASRGSGRPDWSGLLFALGAGSEVPLRRAIAADCAGTSQSSRRGCGVGAGLPRAQPCVSSGPRARVLVLAALGVPGLCAAQERVPATVSKEEGEHIN